MGTYRHTYDVTLSEIDQQFGLPVNSVLGNFTDACARMMASAGIGPADLLARGLFWVISEFHSTIHGRTPRWPESFTVETWVSRLSPLRVHLDYRMYRSDGFLFASGTSVWVVMDGTARRPVDCHVLDPLEGMLHDGLAVPAASFRFAGEGEDCGCVLHTVAGTDTDFNGHMNNQSYVKIAMSMTSLRFTSTHRVSAFHVKFGRESFVGDVLSCTLLRNDDCSYSNVLRRESDGVEVCRMSSEWTETIH